MNDDAVVLKMDDENSSLMFMDLKSESNDAVFSSQRILNPIFAGDWLKDDGELLKSLDESELV